MKIRRGHARHTRARSHPWLYTKEGALDLSWVLLVVGCAAIVACLALEGFHVRGFALPVYAWGALASFVGFCFVAGAARDRAALLANATAPGQVAAAITAFRPPTREISDTPAA